MIGSTISPRLGEERSLFTIKHCIQCKQGGRGPRGRGRPSGAIKEHIYQKEINPHSYKFRIVHSFTQHLLNFSLMNKRLIEIVLIN